MKMKLKHVRPNPFRDMDAYPIHPQKIQQLKKSIESTDFWDNVVARKSSEPGCIEIAYGHHRLVALREMYDGDTEFNFIVRDLDDKDMIKIMAHENLDDWGHDSGIERETVRAIVQAFGEDKIYLPNPQGREDQLRYAPSFCFGKSAVEKLAGGPLASRPYNASSICGFLTGTLEVDTIKPTLQALCLIEQGHLTEEKMSGLSRDKAKILVHEVARSVKQAEVIQKEAKREALNAPTPAVEKAVKKDADRKAKAVVKNTAKDVSKTLQGGGGKTEAQAAGVNARASVQPEDKPLPEINDAAKRVVAQLTRLLDPDYDPAKKLLALIGHKQHLEPSRINDLDVALKTVIEYAEGYRSRLNK